MHRDHGIFPKGQGRIEFRRGTTADPDPELYLWTVNYFNLLDPDKFYKNILKIINKGKGKC